MSVNRQDFRKSSIFLITKINLLLFTQMWCEIPRSLEFFHWILFFISHGHYKFAILCYLYHQSILHVTILCFYSYYSWYCLIHYVCTVEIGKETAISHAPLKWSVIYIVMSLGAMCQNHTFSPVAKSIVLYCQNLKHVCSRIRKVILMCF